MSSTPPLLHRAASSQLFMALMCVPFYCTTVAAVLFCSLSLCHVCSRYIPVSLSITCSLYSSAVAQRQVVISACGVSFQYLCFFFPFSFAEALISASHCCFFCVPFLTSPPPPPPLPSPLFLFHLLAVSPLLSLATLPPLPPCSALPLTLLPLLMTSFLLLFPPHLPLSPASFSGPRMSDAAQSAPR